MKRFRPLLLWFLASMAGAVIGALQLEFDVEILSLLPVEVPAVQSLLTLKDDFESHSELLLLLEGRPGDDLAGKMPEWIPRLQRSCPEGAIRQLGATDPQRGGAMLAWVMQNAPHEALSVWAGMMLDSGKLAAHLEAMIERLASSPDIAEVQRLGYDPLGITEMVGAEALGAAMEADDMQGQPHRVLLAVRPLQAKVGYEAAGQWLDAFHAMFDPEVESLRQQMPGLQVYQTGDIAFMVQAGRGMKRDLSSVLGVSLLLIVALFWFMYRSVIPLVWITLILLIVMGLSLGAGALLLGKISAMNLGFTAIVLGLVVDYGVILLQDSAGRSAWDLRLHATRGILGAAASTAAVFLLLRLSSFPGLRELGLLVSIGVVFGALVMLTAFPPLIAGREFLVQSGRLWNSLSRLPGRSAWRVTVPWIAVVSGVLMWLGWPQFEGSAAPLRPKHSPAMEALDHIQKVALSGQSERQPLVIHAGNATEYAQRRASLKALPPGSFWVPDLFLMSASEQIQNRAILNQCLGQKGAMESAVLAAGFTEDSLVLARAIFAALEIDLKVAAPLLPSQAAAAEDLQRLVVVDHEKVASLGWISQASVAALPLDQPGVHVPSWTALGPELAATAWRDGITWMLPLSACFLVALYFVFRSWRDVGLATAALGAGFLTLLALMKLTGQDWNLASIAAVPLLVGTGIDYSIHVLLALRRSGWDAVAVRQTTGRAILFCALSSAVGFGSLTLASNGGISSLGAACALGLGSMMLVSLLLLPLWGTTSGEDRPGADV